jgi:hypothetical protein
MKKKFPASRSFEDLLKESLKDPEIKRAYDAEMARLTRARKKREAKKSATKSKRAA